MSKLVRDQLTPPGGWRTITTPRLPLIERKKVGFLSKLILSAINSFAKIEVTNLWLLLRINPRLRRGTLFYASRFMPFGDLNRIDTELVVLRVAWNCGTQYVWGQHVQLGMRAGLSIEDIIRISQGPDAEGLSMHQKALLNACDEFHDSRFVSDSTWGILASYFDKRLLLELLFLIGFYEGFGGVINSVGLPLDEKMSSKLSSLESTENNDRIE